MRTQTGSGGEVYTKTLNIKKRKGPFKQKVGAAAAGARCSRSWIQMCEGLSVKGWLLKITVS